MLHNLKRKQSAHDAQLRLALLDRLIHIEGKSIYDSLYKCQQTSLCLTIEHTENLKHLLQAGFKVYRSNRPGYTINYLVTDPGHELRVDQEKLYGFPVRLEGEKVTYSQAIADA